MFKRLVAAATATVLTIAMSVSAFAATSKADRDTILNALTANGLKTSDSYYQQAEVFLNRTDVTITSAQAKDVANQIPELKTELKNAGVKSVAQFEEKLKNDATFASNITAKVNTIAKSAGITNVVIDAKTGAIASFTYDGKKNVPSSNGSFAPTGVDFSTTAAVVAGLGLSVAGIAVIAKKKDLVNA